MSAVSHVGLVKNPLTIIAMFAVIAEVSGAVVLPFLSERVQATYVWFLMLFPFLLVVLFFVTLWAQRDALYGPSDFRDEKHFMDALMRKATPSEVAYKFAVDTANELRDGLEAAASSAVVHQPNEGDVPAGSAIEPNTPGARTAGEDRNEIPAGTGQPSSIEPQKSPEVLVENAPNVVSAIRGRRLAGMMKRREFMKSMALKEVTGRFKQVHFDMKVGDLVVDAVALSREAVSLVETHYVGSAAAIGPALDDLVSVVNAAREFLASADDTAPLRVFFALYSEYDQPLEEVASEVRRFVQTRDFSPINVQVLTTRINKLALATLIT